MDSPDPASAPIGRRIIVVGQTGSGKSTVGARLASLLNVPHVELDAINWLPGWTPVPPEEFIARLTEATSGDGWVVDGAYHDYSSLVAWPRADTVMWLDLPLLLVIPRLLRRSWRRSRSRELLWGTNRERFWPHLKLWNTRESLVAYAISQHRAKRRRYAAAMSDPQWAHLRFVRLRSTAEIDRFLASVEASVRRGTVTPQPRPYTG